MIVVEQFFNDSKLGYSGLVNTPDETKLIKLFSQIDEFRDEITNIKKNV